MTDTNTNKMGNTEQSAVETCKPQSWKYNDHIQDWCDRYPEVKEYVIRFECGEDFLMWARIVSKHHKANLDNVKNDGILIVDYLVNNDPCLCPIVTILTCLSVAEVENLWELYSKDLTDDDYQHARIREWIKPELHDDQVDALMSARTPAR